MCSASTGPRVEDPHYTAIRDGSAGGVRRLEFGARGFVEFENLPAACDCVYCRPNVWVGDRHPSAFLTHKGCGHDMLRAIVERIFMVRDTGGRLVATPQPTRPFDELTGGVRAEMAPLFLPVPVKLQEVPAMMNGKRKKERYSKALDSFRERPPSPADAVLDSFPKIEFANFSKKADPVPRGINPRGARFNIQLARWLKPHEHRIYAGASRWNWVRPTTTPVVLKCANPDTRGDVLFEKWSAFSDPVAFLSDLSRCDQHISKPALEWEHSCYLEYFSGVPGVEELAGLLAQQLRNKGIHRNRVDGTVIRFEVEGVRMSGDMNTALGNCLIVTALYYGLSKQIGVPMEVANDGDDCVVIMERSDAAAFQAAVSQHFLSAGMSIEVGDPVDIFEQIEFCQCRPVWNGTRYTMVRNPMKALSSDLMGAGKWVDDQARRDIVNLIGYGGGHLSAGIPIMQQFYATCRHSQPGTKGMVEFEETGFGRMVSSKLKEQHKTITSKVPTPEITPRSRQSFFWAFGVPPSLQVAIEATLVPPHLGALPWSRKELRSKAQSATRLKDRVSPALSFTLSQSA